MVFYTVSVADTEHGAVSVSVDYQLESNLIPQNVPDGVIIADMGAAVTITAAPDTGCVLDSLTVTKDGTNPAEEVSITETEGIRSFQMPACNVTVTAAFSQWFTVSFDADGGTAVESQMIIAGGTVTKPADPVNGSAVFLGWYKVTDGQMSDTAFDFDTAVNENTALKAMWGYEIILLHNELGSISCISGVLYNFGYYGIPGENVVLTLTPNEGYVLTVLTNNETDVLDSVDSNGQYTFTMPAEAVTVTATYEDLKTITAAAAWFDGIYDGQAHGITVSVTDPASGSTIRYGTTEGAYDLTVSPTITNVADSPLTVYYQITAEGYSPLTGSATVTISKADLVVHVPKPVESLVYTGSEITLVTPGSVENDTGIMYYAVRNDGNIPQPEEYTTSIPTAINVGTYYVWYKAVGDGNHHGTTAEAVVSHIVEPFGAPTFTMPSALTAIEESAFEGNLLMTVVDASHCTSIGANAFKGCTNLTQIKLP